MKGENHMNNNKKPSEPAEEERWGIIHYMRSHRPPWWLYWTPAILWGVTTVIAATAIWLR